MYSRRDPNEQTCGHCGGLHENVPTARGEYGAECPHCGEFYETDERVSEKERHPAVPEDEPLTILCPECNGSFYLRE